MGGYGLMMRIGCALLAVLAFVGGSRADDAGERRATIAYLSGLQGLDGGFYTTRRWTVPGHNATSLRATLAAIRALKYFHGLVPDETACIRFVERCRNAASGGFADRPGWDPDVVSTALGIMALVDLKQPTGKVGTAGMKYLSAHAVDFEDIHTAAAATEALGLRPPDAAAWIVAIDERRKPQFTSAIVPDPVGDAIVAVTTLRLGGPIKDRAALLKTLRASQNPDGGFKGGWRQPNSDLGTCYRIMRSFAMLKEKPGDPAKLRKFVARCRNADGGYGLKPGEPSRVEATYYAGIVLHWLEQQ